MNDPMRAVARFRSDSFPVEPPQGFNQQLLAVQAGDVALDNGAVLPQVLITYQTWGTLNAAGDNAVLVEHALTGDSHVVGEVAKGQPTPGWWPGLIGPGAPLDTDQFFVVAINVLGGCRGTTGPGSLALDADVWGSRFPHITIRDMVRAESVVADVLAVRSWHAVIGGSMGGMRVLEWVGSYPHRVDRALVVASTAKALADQIAWGQSQILAIASDPNFYGGDYYHHGVTPESGLGLARRIAHTTYRSAQELEDRFGTANQGDENPLFGGRFAVESYLDHHADKLRVRFDAMTYVRLTQAMATHDVGRGRGGLAAALRSYAGSLQVVAVDSDRLFPVSSSEEIVAAHGRGEVKLITSDFGHDGFLIEEEQVAEYVRQCVQTPVERVSRWV